MVYRVSKDLERRPGKGFTANCPHFTIFVLTVKYCDLKRCPFLKYESKEPLDNGKFPLEIYLELPAWKVNSQIIDESDLIMHYFIMRVDSCTYKLSIQIYCNSFAPLSRFCRAYNWWDCESAASHSSAALTAMRHRAVMPLKLSL